MVSNYNTLSNVSIMLHGVTRPYKYSFPVRALSRGSNKQCMVKILRCRIYMFITKSNLFTSSSSMCSVGFW